MRTTLYIPDEYYQRIKESYKARGFNTINDCILALVRHYFNAKTQDPHQIDVRSTSSGTVIKTGSPTAPIKLAYPPKKEVIPISKAPAKSEFICEHGQVKYNCQICNPPNLSFHPAPKP